MKRTIIFFLFFYSITARSQDLLVNGGFEDVNICTEFRVECAPEGWVSSSDAVTNYSKQAARAHSGVNCMTIEAGNFKRPFKRTFLRSRLLCGLRKGKQYQLEFFVRSPHDVLDSAGILFSATDPLFDKTAIDRQTPSIYFLQRIEDSAWHRVKFVYTATGEERFIALGYYARTDYVGELAHPLENRYFIYFDDISMIPLDPHEQLCAGWHTIKEEIYDEDERHTLLEKKIKHYKANPPPPPTIVKTAYVIIDTLVLPDILFATGKADLQATSYPLLDSFSRRIMAAQVDSIVVEGHTDSIGTYELNEKLSNERALTVRKYLQQKTGYPAMRSRGWAFLKPVASNKTPEGRQRNRRVEVFLYIRE